MSLMAMLLLLLAVCVGETGCKSAQQEEQQQQAAVVDSDDDDNPDELEANQPIQTLSSNLKINIKGEKRSDDFVLDAQLRMVKDEGIQLSVRMPFLGSEAAKVVVTPTQFLVVDRLHKAFVVEDVQDMLDEILEDWNFIRFQTMLSDRLVQGGTHKLTPKIEVQILDYEKNKPFAIDASLPNPDKYIQLGFDQLLEILKGTL
ncbi:hypothetical protein SAMD00024442_92_3 [Candidatus Symbiothrix dinenymphae]|nr:hypothetical protein SAMD00024442_92_3 [Candidatus Symbiothrix dinenymphae]